MAAIVLTLRYRADVDKYPDHVKTQADASRYDVARYETGEISLAELFDAVGEDELTFEAGE